MLFALKELGISEVEAKKITAPNMTRLDKVNDDDLDLKLSDLNNIKKQHLGGIFKDVVERYATATKLEQKTKDEIIHQMGMDLVHLDPADKGKDGLYPAERLLIQSNHGIRDSVNAADTYLTLRTQAEEKLKTIGDPELTKHLDDYKALVKDMAQRIVPADTINAATAAFPADRDSLLKGYIAKETNRTAEINNSFNQETNSQPHYAQTTAEASAPSVATLAMSSARNSAPDAQELGPVSDALAAVKLDFTGIFDKPLSLTPIAATAPAVSASVASTNTPSIGTATFDAVIKDGKLPNLPIVDDLNAITNSPAIALSPLKPGGTTSAQYIALGNVIDNESGFGNLVKNAVEVFRDGSGKIAIKAITPDGSLKDIAESTIISVTENKAGKTGLEPGKYEFKAKTGELNYIPPTTPITQSSDNQTAKK